MTTANEPEPQADGLPRQGDILAGKFRIDRVLGQGGMGVVVAAEHTTLRQKVAVKFLLPEAMARAGACDRFLREARAAVAIRSEHVARVTDVGTLESGAPYMVMELLTGVDLGALLLERGRLPIPEAIDYLLQAGEAIAEAHALGIVHRDLKPANLFLSSRADGSSLIKVLDFGLSKVPKSDAMDASLTAANVIMGSPFYMSPEQVRSLKGLDARTDVWSLGVILYQLLTGVRPFDAEGLGVLFLMIGADPVTPPSAHRPEIPPALEAAILGCLEKDPARRTQSVAELARALAPFAPAESRLSVDRIQRVLAEVPAGAGGERTPGKPASIPAPAPGFNAAAAPGNLGTEATLLLPDTLPIEPTGVKSGSMSAVATAVPEPASGASPSGASPSRPERRRGLVMVIGVLVAVALGLIGAASFRARGSAADARAPAAAPTAAAPPAPVVVADSPAPVVSAEPAASGTAVAAPSASARVVQPTASARPGALPPRGARKSP